MGREEARMCFRYSVVKIVTEMDQHPGLGVAGNFQKM